MLIMILLLNLRKNITGGKERAEETCDNEQNENVPCQSPELLLRLCFHVFPDLREILNSRTHKIFSKNTSS
jgi:hypothetical protein